jgi:hypothetical protein
MPIKLNDSNSDVFSQIEKGVGTALIQAMQDDQQLGGFRTLLLVSFLKRIRSSRLLLPTKIDY